MSETEFYVGYFPKAGAALARFVRGRIVTLILLVAGAAVAAALWSPRLGPGRFEYGTVRDLDGRVIEAPYPLLAVSRCGSPGPECGSGGPNWSYYVLVGQGKHGAGPAVRGLAGRTVRLSGTLFERDGSRGLEVAAPLREIAARPGQLDPIEDLGRLSLTGEIVDAKCHLGVMTPGEGVTHRGCAIQCIAGGSPPLFVAHDSAGHDWRFLLTDAEGRAVGDRVLDFVAEPVRISGRASRMGSLLFLAVEPSTIERL